MAMAMWKGSTGVPRLARNSKRTPRRAPARRTPRLTPDRRPALPIRRTTPVSQPPRTTRWPRAPPRCGLNLPSGQTQKPGPLLRGLPPEEHPVTGAP
eukprot:7824801-Pyramimonas_sp.AAC.1